MNIFIYNTNIQENVKQYPDKHVVKMITESLQLLSTTMHLKGFGDQAPYKKTHVGHPCVKWTCESFANWKWLYNLTEALYGEYRYRYGKTHLAGEKLKTITDMLENLNFKTTFVKTEQTDFVMGFKNENYKLADIAESYQAYVRNEKPQIKKYTKRPIPNWWEVNTP